MAASQQALKRQKTNATFGAEPAAWVGEDVLSTSQFSEASMDLLFSLADRLKAEVTSGTPLKYLAGRLLACAFMEPSTRTSCSFMAAMQRLGGSAILIQEQGSSAQKGESIEDTVRCLECYADAVVLRHPLVGSARRAADACAKPVLNAGDGVGEHPTQSLLDAYTMRSEFLRGTETPSSGSAGLFAGKVVALVGDLKHGRTAHSLAMLLARTFPGASLKLVSPAPLRMPDDVKAELAAHGAVFTEHEDLAEVLSDADVLYVTRVQKERFADPEEYEALKLKYVVTPATLAAAKPTAVLMHPLPRVGEISTECDPDPRAAYFRQMENGMYVRMALLCLILGAAM